MLVVVEKSAEESLNKDIEHQNVIRHRIMFESIDYEQKKLSESRFQKAPMYTMLI